MRRIGLVLTFFMEVKEFMKLLNLVRKRCINFVTDLNQSDLIILSAEVFVRTSCHHFYLVSLDFLFLSEQTAKGISKRENVSLMHLCQVLKFFLKQFCNRLILVHSRNFFQLTNGIKIIHVVFLR